MKDNYETHVNTFNNHQLSTRQIRVAKQASFDKKTWRLFLVFFASYKKELTRIGNQLEFVQQPVLISWGDSDNNVLVANAYNLKKRVPNSVLHMMKGVGHNVVMDGQETYILHVENWIRTLF